jgi:sialidase-1
VVTNHGTILAYCAARKSDIGDWADIDVAVRRGPDGGKTWESMKILAQEGTSTADNPVAIIENERDTIHFLYQVDYARCYYMSSDDDGISFSEPADITPVFEEFRSEYDWNVLAPGPGHGIHLKSGRLLVPVWLSDGGEWHRPSCVSTIYSDDRGKTWHRGDIVTFHGDTTADGQVINNPSETIAEELNDGRVMLNIRNECVAQRRLISFSNDGATGWSQPEFDTELFEPACMGSITHMKHKRAEYENLFIFANPNSGDSDRRNLTVRLSYDEGRSWPVARVIDPGIAGYSDLAATGDGRIYCLYERGGMNENVYHNLFLTLVQFDLEWLLEKQK